MDVPQFCAEGPRPVTRPVVAGASTARASDAVANAAREWRHPLTGATMGLLLFETVTGLSIYLLPFSNLNQFSVLLHTVLGVLMLAPVGWYVMRHWRQRYRGKFSHYQFLGYFSLAALLVLIVTGLVLTWQGLFGRRIGLTWDLVHIVATFVLILGLGAHLATLLARRTNHPPTRRMMSLARWSCLAQSAAWSGGLVGVCLVASAAYREPSLVEAFPADYSFRYGVDRPFAPSLARKDMRAVEQRLRAGVVDALSPAQAGVFLAGYTPDPNEHVGVVGVAERLIGGFDLDARQRDQIDAALREARDAFRHSGMIHPRRLSGSAGCGTSGCHSEILEEWEPSAHRYASMDFVFQKVQENMAAELAPEATRYCAGCHDPIALFSGSKNVGNITLSVEGADEGVSCLACHTTVQTDVRGNGDYTIAAVDRYVGEFHGGPLAKLVSDFLIRAYPRQHVSSYSRPLYKTAESCGACHKQFIDSELNAVGWVQGQNQYDSWRKSRWHVEGDPVATIGCRECHMPLVASKDPAAGDADDPNRSPDDGKHRSHRFLGANQFVPRHHKLPGAEEQCELTVKWLRGEIDIPEIADRWTSGPVLRLSLNVPEEVRPGEEVRVQSIITNNKTGHDFPTGPMDMIEGWVEVTVRDEYGAIVFASARPDAQGYLVNPRIVWKAELIDRTGDLIGKHELWEMVGARYKRVLFPGFTDATDFVFECPAKPSDPQQQFRFTTEEDTAFRLPAAVSSGELNVTATVWYCKFNAPFLDRLFGEAAAMRSEVTDIAHAEATVRVRRDDLQAVTSHGQ